MVGVDALTSGALQLPIRLMSPWRESNQPRPKFYWQDSLQDSNIRTLSWLVSWSQIKYSNGTGEALPSHRSPVGTFLGPRRLAGIVGVFHSCSRCSLLYIACSLSFRATRTTIEPPPIVISLIPFPSYSVEHLHASFQDRLFPD